MRKLSFLLLFIGIVYFARAQEYLRTDFSDDCPPNGWTISANSANWSAQGTSNAGGVAPEARFNWSPEFSGSSYLISPELDLSGVTYLMFEMKHMVDHYSGAYTLGVATRSGGGTWNPVWTLSPSASIEGTTVIEPISTTDVGASDFQIAIYFSGNSYNINYWYIDDFRVFTPFQYDPIVRSVVTGDQYTAGQSYTPTAVVMNFGLDNVTFDALCEIQTSDGTSIYGDNVDGINLDFGETETITFGSFIIEEANELYKVTVIVEYEQDMDESNNTGIGYFDTNTAPRIVLWEQFTNTSCDPCANANPTIEEVLNDFGDTQVLPIWYHVWWPGNNDPFYQANTADNTTRTQYYGCSAVPDSYTDGVLEPSPGNESSMTSAINARLNKYSAFELTAYHNEYGQNMTMDVNINTVGGVIPGDLRLFVVATESNLEYNAANGEDLFHWVMRDMYPDAEGTVLDLEGGDREVVSVDMTIDTDWVEANVDFIVFIQNYGTGEILQATRGTIVPMLPPINLTGQQVDSDVQLSWETQASTQTGFKVYRDYMEIANIEDAMTTGYTDEEVSGGSHLYYVTAIYETGESNPSNQLLINVVSNDQGADIPAVTKLIGNHPNPFNPSTRISFSLREAGMVQLEIFNLLGQKVKTLVNEPYQAGNHDVTWNGQDDMGRDVGSGLYLYKLKTGRYTSTKKMLLLK